MKDCYYCEKGEKLNQLMTHIADMGNASIYLFRDQTHKGKCIVVFNTDHRTEWYQLNQEEQSELIYAVAKKQRKHFITFLIRIRLIMQRMEIKSHIFMFMLFRNMKTDRTGVVRLKMIEPL